MSSPTGTLSFSQVTVGAGTPITSQVRTRGLPATWLTASALGSSNVGGTAGEKPDSPNAKTLLPLPSSSAAQGCLGRPFSVAGGWYFMLCCRWREVVFYSPTEPAAGCLESSTRQRPEAVPLAQGWPMRGSHTSCSEPMPGRTSRIDPHALPRSARMKSCTSGHGLPYGSGLDPSAAHLVGRLLALPFVANSRCPLTLSYPTCPAKLAEHLVTRVETISPSLLCSLLWLAA